MIFLWRKLGVAAFLQQALKLLSGNLTCLSDVCEIVIVKFSCFFYAVMPIKD